MSATRLSVETEESVSTHSARSTVTAPRATKVSSAVIRPLVVQEMRRRYSVKITAQ